MDWEPTPLTFSNLRAWLAETGEVVDRMRGGPPPRGKPRPLPRLARPLFVLGAPRSGTSLLGDLIGSLPEFSYHYEPPVTKAAARYVYERRWGRLRARMFFRAVFAWLTWRRGEGRARFAEKTPQDCFIVEFLAAAFPDAQFLHIVRDGRDAALSYAEKPWLAERGKKTGQRETGGYPFGPYARFWVEPSRRAEFESTSDLHRCAWAWRRHVEAAQAGLASLPRERALEIRYERLAAEPEEVGREVLDFLKVDAAGSRLALERALHDVRATSVGRHLRELDSEQAAIVDREAGVLLRRLGYLAPAEVRT